MNIIKKIGFLLAFGCLLYGCLELYRWKGRPFSSEHIADNYPSGFHIEPVPVSHEEEQRLRSVFQKTFTFLGQGHQTYAFLSEDGQVVLKFFNFTRLTALDPIEWLPPLPFIKKYQKHLQNRRIKKFNRVFKGYTLAFEKDRDNTGVLYVHLQKTTHLNAKVTVIDAFQNKYAINLDEVLFVIQKKAETTRKILTQSLENRDIKGFKKRISQLIQLYLSEYQRGLYDSDHNIMSNTGFIGDRACRIDVGRLSENEEMRNPENYLRDINKVFNKRILKWVQKKYPAHYEELSRDIQVQLKSKTNTSGPLPST